MKKIKIEIKNRWTGRIIFEYESENNTIKKTLINAYLQGADLQCAYLQKEKLKSLIWIIPEEGNFIAWKKLSNNCIAKIKIPTRSLRTCNALNRKCRAKYVKTLNIFDKNGVELKEQSGQRDANTIYKVGRLTHADSWDNNIFNDCTHGIHFFVTKQEAIDW